jgi:uncharacterized membrane protein
MSWLLLLLGIFLLLLGVVILVNTFLKAEPKTEKDAEVYQWGQKHKWKLRIIGIILCLIGIGFLTYKKEAKNVQSVDVQQKAEKIVKETQQEKEKELSKEKEQEEEYKRTMRLKDFQHAFQRALKEINPITRTKIEGNEIRIFVPYDNVLDTHVGSVIGDSSFMQIIINCYFETSLNERRLGKNCLSNKDKDGLSILQAISETLNFPQSTQNKFIEVARKCVKERCEDETAPQITLTGSDNKKYSLTVKSYFMFKRVGTSLTFDMEKPEYLLIYLTELNK